MVGRAPAWGPFMLLHSENGNYSCTLNPSTKTPCCLIPRYGEPPCEAKTASKSSFLFSFYELYCRPVSFLPPGWLTAAELWCGAGPVPLSHPWSTAALSQGGDELRTSPAASVRCRAPCAPALVSVLQMLMSTSQGASGTLENHRAAGWPLVTCLKSTLSHVWFCCFSYSWPIVSLSGAFPCHFCIYVLVLLNF